MGFLFLILYPAPASRSRFPLPPPAPASRPRRLRFVTHSLPHNFVTHHLSHTTLSHTIFHTHTSSAKHNFVVHNFVTHHLSRTTLSHTIFHTPSLAGVALHDIHFRFAWQAWHFWRWAGLVGRLGAVWAPLGRCWSRGDAAALCMAGVALGDIHHFAWQAWHCTTSTLVLRGRHGTSRHRLSFRVAGVGLGHIDHRFVWHAWQCLMETLAKHSGMFTETLGSSHA